MQLMLKLYREECRITSYNVCYTKLLRNEEGNVYKTASVVAGELEKNSIEYEIVFINDGSADKTWDKLCEVCNSFKNITVINFSRNFGKESAIFAGLKYAKGDACVVMDCDLQHRITSYNVCYTKLLRNLFLIKPLPFQTILHCPAPLT